MRRKTHNQGNRVQRKAACARVRRGAGTAHGAQRFLCRVLTGIGPAPAAEKIAQTLGDAVDAGGECGRVFQVHVVAGLRRHARLHDARCVQIVGDAAVLFVLRTREIQR